MTAMQSDDRCFINMCKSTLTLPDMSRELTCCRSGSPCLVISFSSHCISPSASVRPVLALIPTTTSDMPPYSLCQLCTRYVRPASRFPAQSYADAYHRLNTRRSLRKRTRHSGELPTIRSENLNRTNSIPLVKSDLVRNAVMQRAVFAESWCCAEHPDCH